MNEHVCAHTKRKICVGTNLHFTESSCSVAAGKTSAATVFTAETAQIPVNQN